MSAPTAAGSRSRSKGCPSPSRSSSATLETRAGSGTYLRLAGEEQSYLVGAELDPARTPVGWLDQSLIDVAADDVEFIEVRQDDGAVLRIERGDDGLAVVDLPADRSLASETAPRSMAGVLRSFTLDDVRPATDFADEPPAAVAEYGLADGRVLTARLWQRDDGRYAALRVAYAPPAAATATRRRVPTSPWPTNPRMARPEPVGETGGPDPATADDAADETPGPTPRRRPRPRPNWMHAWRPGSSESPRTSTTSWPVASRTCWPPRRSNRRRPGPLSHPRHARTVASVARVRV